jgi:hypothetical protein
MAPTRIRAVAAVAVLCALAWLALLLLFYRVLPPLPWSAVPTLLVVGLAEAYSGLLVQARIRGRPGTKPVEPISVARTVALAKASAYAAAVVGGVAAGTLLRVIRSLDKPIPRHDALTAVATLAAAAAMAAAALYLQHCCRVPDRSGDGGNGG